MASGWHCSSAAAVLPARRAHPHLSLSVPCSRCWLQLPVHLQCVYIAGPASTFLSGLSFLFLLLPAGSGAPAVHQQPGHHHLG
jgi:hypothetical protein